MKPREGHAIPFSNGTEGECWIEANCERCQKRNDCPMEQAVRDGFLFGDVPVALAVEYGAAQPDDDREYIDLPRQCGQFAGPKTCECHSRPHGLPLLNGRLCGRAPVRPHNNQGYAMSICDVHAAIIASEADEAIA